MVRAVAASQYPGFDRRHLNQIGSLHFVGNRLHASPIPVLSGSVFRGRFVTTGGHPAKLPHICPRPHESDAHGEDDRQHSAKERDNGLAVGVQPPRDGRENPCLKAKHKLGSRHMFFLLDHRFFLGYTEVCELKGSCANSAPMLKPFPQQVHFPS